MNNLNIKKINKILIVTLIIFSSIVLADYSKSSSRYYKEQEVISFDTSLIKLYHSTGNEYSFSFLVEYSDANKAKYAYSFDRNVAAFSEQEILNNTNEQYKITINSGCVIDSIIAYQKSITLPNDIANTYTITFDKAPGNVLDNNNNPISDRIRVEYHCPVDIENDNIIETDLTIREKIDGDQNDFLYLTYKTSMTIEEYKTKINYNQPEITYNYNEMTVPKSLITNVTTMKIGVKNWLQDYVSTYRTNNSSDPNLSNIIISGGPLSPNVSPYNNPLERFICQNFSGCSNFQDLSNYIGATPTSTIPGLKITETNDNYVFEIDKDFVGYALTDQIYSDTNRVFYFSNITLGDGETETSKKIEIETIFDYYVNKYMTTNAMAVKSYFSTNGSIYSLINGTSQINPMMVNYNGGRIYFNPNFLTSPVVIDLSDKNDDETTIKTAIINSIYDSFLNTIWPEDYCSSKDSSCESFRVKQLIQETPFMNNLSNPKRKSIVFNDYLVYYTGTKYILINIYNEEINKDKFSILVSELPTGFYYQNATTITYVTSIIDKTNTQLVNEIKQYTVELDNILSTNYTSSITESLIEATDYEKGIFRIDLDYTSYGYSYIARHVTLTFVNTIETTTTYLDKSYPFGHVPDANESSASVTSIEETEEPISQSSPPTPEPTTGDTPNDEDEEENTEPNTNGE